jgi:hypothetical protein
LNQKSLEVEVKFSVSFAQTGPLNWEAEKGKCNLRHEPTLVIYNRKAK